MPSIIIPFLSNTNAKKTCPRADVPDPYARLNVRLQFVRTVDGAHGFADAMFWLRLISTLVGLPVILSVKGLCLLFAGLGVDPDEPATLTENVVEWIAVAIFGCHGDNLRAPADRAGNSGLV